MAGAGVVAEALKQVSVPNVLITPAKFLKWDDVSSIVMSLLNLGHNGSLPPVCRINRMLILTIE